MNNKLYAGVIFLLSIGLSFAFFVFKDFFSQTLSLGLIGLFIVHFVSNASFFLSGPSFLTVIAAGDIYPPVLVAIVASLGAAFGDMVGYLFGHSGRALTKKRIEKSSTMRFVEKHFHKYGGLIIFVMAFIPNFVFDAIGIFAGIMNYSPIRFFVIILIGRFLRYWLLAQFGSKL